MDAELTAFLTQRFDEIGRQFVLVDQRFIEVNRRFETMDRRFDAMDQRLDRTRTEFGALVERLRDEVHQIAEGHALLDRKLDRFRDENETAHREILGLLRGSHRDLDHRVSRLESRLPDEGGPAR